MYSYAIDIAAAPEDVFDELSHVERHPTWANPKADMTMEQTDGDGPGPGARYRSSGVFVNKAVTADIAVTTYEPDAPVRDPLGPAPGGQERRLVPEQLHARADRRRHPAREVDRQQRQQARDPRSRVPAIKKDAMTSLTNLKRVLEARA